MHVYVCLCVFVYISKRQSVLHLHYHFCAATSRAVTVMMGLLKSTKSEKCPAVKDHCECVCYDNNWLCKTERRRDFTLGIQGIWEYKGIMGKWYELSVLSLPRNCIHASFSLSTSSAGLVCRVKGWSSESTVFLKLKQIPLYTVLSAMTPAGTYIRGCWVDLGSRWAGSYSSERAQVDGISLDLIWVSKVGWTGPGLERCSGGDKGELGKNKRPDVPSDSALQTIPGHWLLCLARMHGSSSLNLTQASLYKHAKANAEHQRSSTASSISVRWRVLILSLC